MAGDINSLNLLVDLRNENDIFVVTESYLALLNVALILLCLMLFCRRID